MFTLLLIPTFFIISWYSIKIIKKPAKIKTFFDIGMPFLQPIAIFPNNKKSCWLLHRTRRWILAKDFIFTIDGVEYIIKTGFVTDLASTPTFLWWLLPPDGILLRGSIIHDYIYSKTYLMCLDGTRKPFTRKEADKLFENITENISYSAVLGKIVYFFLRLFGWIPWRNHRKKDKKKST